jgi:N-acetylglucosamine kinase-like BadF-type ATPase|tara:strand:- start:84 stop:2816 length:2733 start_codon:yes stop_codon:yes gene_type:complete
MANKKLLYLEEKERRNLANSKEKAYLEEARNRGLIKGRSFSIKEKIGAIGQGLNTALGNLAGTTVDLVNELPKLTGKALSNVGYLFPTQYGRADPKDSPYSKIPVLNQTITESLGGTPDAIGGRKNITSALAKTNMGYRNIKDIPPNLRPYAIGGEVLGNTASFAAAPYLAVRKAAASALTPESILAPILRKAKESPVEFGRNEAIMGGLSATGGGFAETLVPGNPTARMYGEILAPLSPSTLAARNVPNAIRSARRAITSRFGEEGKNREAAKILQEAVTASGGNPEEVAKQLYSPASKSLTSGQITGDKGLLAIEKKLLSLSSQTAGLANTRTKESIKDFNKQFQTIMASGDKQSMVQASEKRLEVLTGYLDSRVKIAEDLLNKRSDVFQAMPKTQANIQAKNILLDALKDGRKTETELWNKIDRKPIIVASNTKNTIEDIYAKLAKGKKLDSVLTAYRKDFKKTDNLTAEELLNLKTEAGASYREYTANGKFALANQYKRIEKSVRNDLAKLDSPEVIAANKYSAYLNENFTQKPVIANILKRNRAGGEKVNSELSLNAALLPKDVGNINLKDIRQAAGLGITPTSINSERATDMADLQNNLLRGLAAETRTINDVVDPKKLENFVKQYAPSLKTAGLYNRFENVIDAKKTADKVIKAVTKMKKSYKAKSVTSRIANNDINRVINFAFNSNNKARDFGSIAKAVGSRGREGAQYAIMENILESATRKNSTGEEVVFGAVIKDKLNSTTETGETVANLLIRKGLLTRRQKENIEILANKAEIFENAIKSSETLDELLETEDVIFEFFLRTLGAKAAGLGIGGNFSGSGLIVAGAGSKSFRNILSKMPQAKIKDVLKEAMFDPKKMELLLLKPVNAAGKARQIRQLNAVFLQAGIDLRLEEEEGTYIGM